MAASSWRRRATREFDPEFRIIFETSLRPDLTTNPNLGADYAATPSSRWTAPDPASSDLGHVSLPEGTERVDYAVAAKQGGSESWDNHFIENFGCVIDPPHPGLTQGADPWNSQD